MKFEILKLEYFSGPKASFYTVFVEDLGKTLFEQFLEENINDHKTEIDEILTRIQEMSIRYGARD